MTGTGIAKVALLNNPLAAAGDIFTNTAATPDIKVITGLAPILVGSITVEEQVAAAEVLAQYSIGRDSNSGFAPPTIVSGQTYGFGILADASSETTKLGVIPFKQRAPDILTGDAGKDRHNIYLAWAYRVNSMLVLNMAAYAVVSATLSGAVAAGTLVTGATSGAKGIILQTGAVENLGVITGNFANGEALTNTTTGVATGQTLTTVDTYGVAFVLRDKYGYYRANSPRLGASTVLPGPNIPSLYIVQDVAPVYGVGQGSIMLGYKPIMETSTGNLLAGGSWNYPSNEDPQAGSFYSNFVIRSKVVASQYSDNDNLKNDNILTQYLYVRNDATGFAALRTALLALS